MIELHYEENAESSAAKDGQKKKSSSNAKSRNSRKAAAEATSIRNELGGVGDGF